MRNFVDVIKSNCWKAHFTLENLRRAVGNTLISLIICACLKKLNGIPQEKIKEYLGFSNKKCLKYTYCTTHLQHDINI